MPPEGSSSHGTLCRSALAWVGVGFLLKPSGLCFQANKADAVTLDGGLVFEASLKPYNLRPIAAEVYGTQESEFSLRTQSWGGRGCGPGPCGVRGMSCRGGVSNGITPEEQGPWVLWARG